MKKSISVFSRALSLLLVSFVLLTLTVAATGGAGSKEDPLVTLSYLNANFLPEVLAQADARVVERNDALSTQLAEQIAAEKAALEKKYAAASKEGALADTVDSFVVVTMSRDQVLYGEIGCEVMLRVGTAVCVSPSSPGLIDSTDATTLDSGKSLVKNHLYMMTIDERGVKATADTVKVLVRGTYEVK
ncbi:MAG: hypothetical protein IIX99_04925 [Oscillospiraceae bacterium]|nr:hypothetical protein [Oscillospiraceae bacterium]